MTTPSWPFSDAPILPTLRFAIGSKSVPHEECDDDPMIEDVRRLFGAAADIVASEFVSGRAHLRPTNLREVHSVTFEIERDHESAKPYWVAMLAGTDMRGGDGWAFYSFDSLTPDARRLTSRIEEAMITVLDRPWPPKFKGQRFRLHYGASWKDISSHAQLELHARAAALLGEPATRSV
jgi:hypothetical protein